MRRMRTTGNRALDEEIDLLWRELEVLKRNQGGDVTNNVTVQEVAGGLGSFFARLTGGSPYEGVGLEVPASADISYASGGFVLLNMWGLLNAKGDLIGATADGVPGRLAVGSNGQYLSADSGETTGLKWVTPGAGVSFSFHRYTSNASITASTTVVRLIQVDGSGGAVAVTLPDPSTHTMPIFIGLVAGSGSVARNGSENIDGAAASVSLNMTTVGEVKAIGLMPISGHWYSFLRIENN